MIESRIVRRYATALFAAASKADAVDQVESDLGLVSYTIEQSPALWEALTSPVLPSEKKCEILAGVFEGSISAITLSYLKLCVSKRREEVIRETEAEYIALANEARGIVKAEVTSAVELSPDQEARLVAKLSQTTGKRIELSKNVDPSLVGGLLVRIGDKVIDGTIRGQLSALREELLS